MIKRSSLSEIVPTTELESNEAAILEEVTSLAVVVISDLVPRINGVCLRVNRASAFIRILSAVLVSASDFAFSDVVVKTVLVDCFRIEGVPRLMRVFFAAGNFVSVAGTSTVILVILAPPSEAASTLAVVSTITLVSTVDSTSEFDKIVVVFSPVDLIRFWAL